MTFSELFTARAARHPERVALSFGGAQWTYGELERRANLLARHLLGLGVAAEEPVGVCLQSGPELILAFLALAKTGGVYLPLDPSYPRQRLELMVSDSGLRRVILVRAIRPPVTGLELVALDEITARAEPGEPLPAPVALARPESLAYLIYTSGSTGRPKGALIHHRALVSLQTAQRSHLGLRGRDRVLQFASASFDVSIGEIAMALLSGAALVMAERSTLATPERLAALIDRERVSVLVLPPSMLGLLAPRPSLRVVVSTGEACPVSCVRVWAAEHPFFNAYGPTETTIFATMSARLEVGSQPVIGRALAGYHVHLLDRTLCPVSGDGVGEIYIGGHGVGRGYHRRPGLSAERFLPDPLAGEPGARMYRTGDLGRWLPDRQLLFLGRIDHQLKIRGHRVEAGEVEAVLETHPGVRRAVVAIRGAGADARLTAWVAAADEQTPLPVELREWVASCLPVFMVPSQFVVLASLPLLPNGKLDRARLPEPTSGARGRAPATPVERALALIWCQVLGVEEVGMDDSFFDLGGHSLLSARMVTQARERLGVEIPVGKLLEIATLELLAAEVERLRHRGGGSEEPALEPIDRSSPLPLSFAQQRMCVAHQLAVDSTPFHVTASLRLEGPFDPATLALALREVTRRHEVLRTTFRGADGALAQHIAAPGPVPLPIIDLRGVTPACRRSVAERWIVIEAAAPFDLARGPLLRTRLVRLAPEEWILTLTMHHVITDDRSLRVLIEELTALYDAQRQGLPSPLPELPIQYADFAVWQRRRATGGWRLRQLDYWRRVLAGAPSRLELGRPGAEPPGGAVVPRGAFHYFRWPAGLSAGLRKLGRENKATLFMTVLAVFMALLYRRTGCTDQVVVTDVANRERPGLEALIGCFINLVALRVNLRGDLDFLELLGRTRRVALDAYDHQELPFSEVVHAAGIELDPSGAPPFNLYFALELEPPLASAHSLSDGIRVERLAGSTPPALRELTLSLHQHDGMLTGLWHYNTARFDPPAIERLSRELERLAEEAVRDPHRPLDQLGLESAEEAAARQAVRAGRRERALDKLKRIRPEAVAREGDTKVLS